MRESMPNTQGYVDRGPRKSNTFDQYPRALKLPEPGQVVVTGPDGSSRERPAYGEQEVKEIVRQGKQNPRPLTLLESRTADQNRRQARGDSDAMEGWFSHVSYDPDYLSIETAEGEEQSHQILRKL